MNQTSQSSSSDEDIFLKKQNKYKKIKLNNDRKINKKTELCNNYVVKGSCRYGNKCLFAHGEEDLLKQFKNENFKTKPCKNFFRDGVCSYGMRCQYMHSEVKSQMFWWGYMKKHYKRMGVPYTFPWDKGQLPKHASSLRVDILRFQRMSNILVKLQDDIQNLVIVDDFERLPYFIQVSDQ